MRKRKVFRKKTFIMSGSFVAAFLLSGCAGIELGGRVGAYRVDSREERQSTRIEQTKPLKCYFVDCPTIARGVQNDK